jgi:hypothetical protein
MKFQGKIETQGTYKDLVASQTDFAHLLAGGDEETENKNATAKLSTQISIKVSYCSASMLCDAECVYVRMDFY